MWCLEKLCEFMKSPLRKMLSLPSFSQTEKEDSSLSNLLKALPKLLLKQYEYEDQHVKRGKQLMYSPFFKVNRILRTTMCETLNQEGSLQYFLWRKV